MDGRLSSFGARRRALGDAGSAERIASASGHPPVWRESRWFNGSGDTDDITLATDGGRESSLASWQEDDFDRQASLTVHALFAAIDASLYENQPLSDAQLERECRDWATRFAHMRVVGVRAPRNGCVSLATPYPPPVTIDTTGQLHGYGPPARTCRRMCSINVPTLDEYSTDQLTVDDDEPTTSAPSQRRHSQTSIDSNDYNTDMMPMSMDVINEMTKLMLPKVTAQILPTTVTGKKQRTSKRTPNGVHRTLERQSILRRTIPDKVRVSTVKQAASLPPPTAQRNIRFASSQPQLHHVPVPSTSGGADWRNSSEHWWERHYRAASTHVARHTPKSADNVRLPPIAYRYTMTSQSQRAMSTRSWEKPTTSASVKTTVSDGYGTAKSGMPRLLSRRTQMHQHRVMSRSRSTNSMLPTAAVPTVQQSATSKSTVDSAYASAEHSRRGTHKISTRHKPNRTMSISPQRRLHHA